MPNLIKKIEKLDKHWIFSKQTVTVIVISVLFVVFNPFIKGFISEWLVFKSKDIESSYLFDSIIVAIFILTGLFLWHKIQVAYRASFLHYLIFGIIVFPYSFYRFSKTDWEYINIKFLPNDTLAYLDILILLLIPYPIIMLFKFITKKKEERNQYKGKVFVEDIPIKDDEEDKLGYKNIVSNILNPIIHDTYSKAFTIGLVGPWGNGKSSLLSLFKQELEKKDIDNIIEVEFSPFLNHNEKDIISDFFNALCDKLKRYDGTLYKEISNYSEALLKLYNTGNIVSLLDLNIDLDRSLPVYDLYNRINISLGEINKKIIVYVDDLDRLNPIEISETLKLIRNTANFTNTVFIVALDKDYVIKTLKGDNSNKHYKFLEKFFQLEVYLPEIPQKILKEEFINTLKNSNEFDESDIVLINNALTNKRNHFNRFIHNIRDVKRLVNQLIFESKFVFKEIDKNDYLNFIFLKINFPRFIQLLNERKEDFLEIRDGKFSLIEIEPTNNEELTTKRITDILNKSSLFTVDYKKYKISSVFNPHDENCFKSILGIDCVEFELLISVLVALFEMRDDLPYNSIQFERNFYKVMRLSYAKDDLREEDFNELLKPEEDIEKFNNTLEKLLSRGLGEQLITRIDYHEIKNKTELYSLAKVLFYFWRRSGSYNFYLHEITRILSKYLNINNQFKIIHKDSKLTKEETKSFVSIQFLENKDVHNSLKVRLLALLKENEHETGLWGFSKNELNNLGIQYFEEFLKNYKEEIWGLEDYSCYNYYHQLKHICDQNKLNDILKEYLKRVNDIDVFCSQCLDKESFSILIYGVSEFVVTVFGSYLEFKSFIENHKSVNKDSIKEFLKFYELLLIGNFHYRRKFVFKSLRIRDYSFQGKVSEYDKLESEKLVQIHLKFHQSLKDFNPRLNGLNFNHSTMSLLFENVKYLFIGTTQATKEDCLNQIFNSLKENLNEDVEVKVDLNGHQYIENISGDRLIELFSVQ